MSDLNIVDLVNRTKSLIQSLQSSPATNSADQLTPDERAALNSLNQMVSNPPAPSTAPTSTTTPAAPVTSGASPTSVVLPPSPAALNPNAAVTPATSPAPTPASAAPSVPIAQIQTPTGNVLSTPDGRPLYAYTGATPQDAARWQPYTLPQGTSPAGLPAGFAVDPTNQQFIYNGQKLYTNVNDAPQQVTGAGQSDAGGTFQPARL